MTDVALCTDSSSLLSPAAAATIGVDVVTVPVSLDGEQLDDELSLDRFYERLEEGAVATTSQPSSVSLAAAYSRAAHHGAEAVLSIHLDSRTSGTVAAARSAATTSSIPVLVVDTQTLSYGVAVCVRAAAEALGEGLAFADAAEVAARTGTTLRTAFVSRRGRPGRIPPSDDWMVLTYERGIAKPLAGASTTDAAIAEMTRIALEAGARISVAVGHAGARMETAADDLAHRLVGADGVVSVERYRVGAPVGAHTGPVSFGLFWWPAGS